MNIQQKRDLLHLTDDEARHIANRLDHADADSAVARTLDRQLKLKWALVSELREAIDTWESGSARRGAEARLAYHVENDTLDLY